MADLTRGVIAGFVAGIVFGIISLIQHLMYVMIVSPATTDPWSVLLIGMFFIMLPASLVGLVFGLVYAAAYNVLPGSTGVNKGIAFSVVFWLIYHVLLGGLPFFFAPALWVGFVVNSVIVGFILSLVWGLTLGWVWDRVGG